MTTVYIVWVISRQYREITTNEDATWCKKGGQREVDCFVRIFLAYRAFEPSQPPKPCPAAIASPQNPAAAGDCLAAVDLAIRTTEMVWWMCTNQCTSTDLCTRDVPEGQCSCCCTPTTHQWTCRWIGATGEASMQQSIWRRRGKHNQLTTVWLFCQRNALQHVKASKPSHKRRRNRLLLIVLW
jgi:hypothetical protein